MASTEKEIQPLQKTNQQLTTTAQPSYSFDGLTPTHIRAYGIGHTLNDLALSCWYSYLLYFLKKILLVDIATDLMLIGQVTDGIITPFMGCFSGKCDTRIGQRKPWYILSIFFIAIPNTLLYCGFKSQNKQLQALFYISATVLFCFGYAAMQINHMSLVPAITCSRKRRDQLNNLRNMFTFVSNFIVLGIGLLIFSVMTDKLLQYKIVPYSCILIGVMTSVYFVCSIDQPQLTAICKEKQTELKKLLQQQKSVILTTQNQQPTGFLTTEGEHLPPQMLGPISKSQVANSFQNLQRSNVVVQSESALTWFRVPKFYIYGVCYIGAQLYVNVFGTLLPFYITDVLKMVESTEQKVSFNLALTPMLVYIGSVLMSCKLDNLYQKIGRKYSLLLGTLLCVLCSTSMAFIDESHANYFYGVVVIVGVSQSLVLSTAFTMISDVVAAKEKSGTFVFGIYSMLEKVTVGICVFFVTGADSYSKTQDLITDSDRIYIKWTTILVPSISCFVSAIILSLTTVNEYTNPENETKAVNKAAALQKELIL